MPAWVHHRANRIMESTQKEYGKEKGKNIAFALANMQGHALHKTPKTWKGEPYGTPQGRRDAKAKYQHPSQMKKTALEELFEFMGKSSMAVSESRESRDLDPSNEPDKIIIYPEPTPPTPSDMELYRQDYPTPDLRGGTTSAKTGAADEPSEEQLVAFFTRTPNPPDDSLHQWAESNGWDVDKAEAAAYRLATRHAEFMTGGKSGKEGKKPEDFSPDQVAKGVKVEKEHTDNVADRKKITADHLTEKDTYYNDPLFESDLKEAAVREDGSLNIETVTLAASMVLEKFAEAGDLSERAYAGMPLGLAAAGALGGGLSGASAAGMPGALIGGAAGGLGGLTIGGLLSMLQRKVEGRALLGRLRREKGLLGSEKRNIEEEGRHRGDKRTFPISRLLTHPGTAAVGGGVLGAGLGTVGGLSLARQLDPMGDTFPNPALAGLLAATGGLAGAGLGAGAGHLGQQLARQAHVRRQETLQERRKERKPGWYTKEEKMLRERA